MGEGEKKTRITFVDLLELEVFRTNKTPTLYVSVQGGPTKTTSCLLLVISRRGVVFIGPPALYRCKLKTQSEASDRIDEESGEVGDALPLGLNERRVTVEDDVSQTISK